MENRQMDLVAELNNLLKERKMKQLKERLEDMNEVDVAAFLEQLPQNKVAMVFRILAKEQAAEIFSHLDIDIQENIIGAITDREVGKIIEELYVDDAVDLLEELPANMVKRVMRSATPETRNLINEYLQYPENSAGSIMTAEFIDLKKEMNVRTSFERIRRIGENKEDIYTCFVTSYDRKLEGITSVRDLLLNNSESKIEEIMNKNIISAVTTDDQEEVADVISKYDLLSIPVVDHENRLVGIITVDDIIDVIEQEATEDIAKMAAVTPSDKSYMKTSVLDIWKARIPWLLLLMVSATFTGMIIQSFEKALAAQVILTAYIPMLMDTGGNSGGQSSATIVRALSLGDVEFKDFFKVLWKEVRVAVLCAVTLAVTNFLKLIFLDKRGVEVSLVVCLTLICTVFFAKVVGCTLPMISKRIGFDPAVMASPFITTIVDAISLIIYFAIATAILRI